MARQWLCWSIYVASILQNTETRCYPLFNFSSSHFWKTCASNLYTYINICVYSDVERITCSRARKSISKPHVRQTRNNWNEPVRCWRRSYMYTYTVRMLTVWYGGMVWRMVMFSRMIWILLCRLKRDILFQSAEPTGSRLCHFATQRIETTKR